MKFKIILAFSAFSLVLYSSCKNTINVQAPYKDVTVVYGLLDQNDPIHYIRINKGFEGVGNAYAMAKQYDSIYYPVGNISAILKDSNTTTNAVVSIPLDTTTTVPLSPGTFTYPTQLLYKTNATLNPNDIYNLLITNTKTGKTVRGSTNLLQDIVFSTPKNLTSPHTTLTLLDEPNYTNIEWTSSANARIYQMTLVFYYDNQVGTGPRVLQTPLQLVLGAQTAPTLSGGATMTYELNAQQLFALIISSVPPINGITRYADSLGIVFTSGTDDLNTYVQLNQAPSGLNQDIPSYTDVRNGIGLFTARHIQTFSKLVDGSVIDSLTQEPRFVNLGFIP